MTTTIRSAARAFVSARSAARRAWAASAAHDHEWDMVAAIMAPNADEPACGWDDREWSSRSGELVAAARAADAAEVAALAALRGALANRTARSAMAFPMVGAFSPSVPPNGWPGVPGRFRSHCVSEDGNPESRVMWRVVLRPAGGRTWVIFSDRGAEMRARFAAKGIDHWPKWATLRHRLLHADHGVGWAHVKAIIIALDAAGPREAPTFSLTCEIPEALPALPSLLWGPAAGDPPVEDAEVIWKARGSRPAPSRMVARPARPSRLMTAHGIVSLRSGIVIWTAHGGPMAPREPATLDSREPWEVRHEAAEFWRVHALAMGGVA